MRKILFLLTIAGMTLISALALTSCGDTSTGGTTNNNWKINILLARNGETGSVSVYAEILKDSAAFVSAVLKVDNQSVQSLGNGKYTANLDPALLSDTSLITITTPLDPFQFRANRMFIFQLLLVVPPGVGITT